MLFCKMETASRAEVMEAALLKVGIPVAVISVAGFIYARIARKSGLKDNSMNTQVSSPKTNPQDAFTEEDGFQSLSPSCIYSVEDEETVAKAEFEEILGLRNQIEELENRGWELEKKFVRYCDLKEQESELMDHKNTLLLEKARIAFLDREISWVETENEILNNLLSQYFGIIKRLEHEKSENEQLQRKVRRLLRRIKAQSRVLREQKMKIEAGEAEILCNHKALETKNDVIKHLEDEVRELHKNMDQTQEEKIRLLKKLEIAEKSAPSISEIEEGVTKEAYDQLVNELEQLQKDRAAEVKEVIFLRWINACLRHELMRSRDEKRNQAESCVEACHEPANSRLESESDGPVPEQNEPFLVVESSGHSCSRKGKLLQRIRRWMEGGEKTREKPNEKRSHERKRNGALEATEEHLHARSPCSSADHKV